MKRHALLVVPGLLGEPGDPVPVPPTLTRLAERGTVVGLRALEPCDAPELAYLGVRPDGVAASQGAITVAALGAEPPPRDVRMHVSLLGLADGSPAPLPRATDDELADIARSAARLDSPALRFVPGPREHHALVWESGSLDVGLTKPSEAWGRPLPGPLPEGDGERLLRGFVENSVELLAQHPVNRERRERGEPPLALLWPWGAGLGLELPNVPVLLGHPLSVATASLRVTGLARSLRVGVNADAADAVALLASATPSLAVVERFAAMSADERRAHGERLVAAFEERWLAPLFGAVDLGPWRLTVLAPSPPPLPAATDPTVFPAGAAGSGGLGLIYDSEEAGPGTLPFDERSLDDSGLSWRHVAEAAWAAWGP